MPTSDYRDLLVSLPARTRRNIQYVHKTLSDAGYECYLVGGAVRDLLLRRPAGDIDITTNARPQKVRQLFRRTIPTGLQHGTVTVLVDASDANVRSAEASDAALRPESFEVTTYRAESDYTDARHPDRVEFAEHLSDDLGRRDFTVNALAFEPGRQELIDLFGGLTDLRAGILRTIGRPDERFYEDGLRTVRACRFAATLEFELESETARTLRDPSIQARTAQVAIERFSDELWKGFRAPKVSRMIGHLESSGLLYLFFTDRPPPTAPETRELLDLLDPAVPVLRMAAWWARFGYTPRDFREHARRLKFSNKQLRDLEWYAKYFVFQADPAEAARAIIAGAPDDRHVAVRVFLSALKESYREQAADFLRSVASWPETRVPVSELLDVLARDPLTVRDLAIDGSALTRRGIEGPAIGESLRWLLEQVWHDPALNTAGQLLELLDRRPPSQV